MEEDWEDLIHKFRRLEIEEKIENRPQNYDYPKEIQLEVKESRQQEFCKWLNKNFVMNFYRPKEFLEEWKNEYLIVQITLFRFRDLDEEIFIPVGGGPSRLLGLANSLERNHDFKLILLKLNKEWKLRTINLFSWRSTGVTFISHEQYIRGEKYVCSFNDMLYASLENKKTRVFGEKLKKKIYAKDLLNYVEETLSLLEPIQKSTNEDSM